MTDAGWTSNKPKEAGLYWWQRHEALPAQIVQVIELNLKKFAMCYMNIDNDTLGWIYLDDSESDGLFLGPLSPDTYHQGRVAGELFGLQQGLLIAYIFESGTAKQVIEGIKSRIAEIEQQAQGGKP